MKRMLIPLLLILLSVNTATAQETPECIDPLWVYSSLIGDKDHYLPQWRDVEPFKAEQGPPWFEGRFISQGDEHAFVPSKTTMYGALILLMRIYRDDDVELAQLAASLIAQEAEVDKLTLGPHEYISHELAISIVQRATIKCLSLG